MKKVLPLLLLALLLCQCDNQSKPKQTTVKSNQELYPEKFTESYIGERVSQLWGKFLEFDMEDGSLKEVFSESYFKLWEEWSFLPQEYLTELGSAWTWMEAVESLSYPLQILETKVVDDSTAYVILKGNFSNPRMDLAFVGDDWVIDDFDPTSQAYLNELISDQREWMSDFDWDEEMRNMKEIDNLEEDEAVEIVNDFRKEVEAYFERYPIQ